MGIMQLSISEQLMYSTARIECVLHNGVISVGTGFFYKFPERDDGKYIPVIVTNKHVVSGSVKGNFILTESDEKGNPLERNHLKVEFDKFEDMWKEHPDKDVDLCIMPIAAILKKVSKGNKQIFYRHMEKWMIKNSEE